ncbi:MAG: formate/nitrite transporter family protein [Ruminococcus sp.]
MFHSYYTNVTDAARKKLEFLKGNPVGYFTASMLAGMFISFGSFISMTAGAYLFLESTSAAKLLSAFCFASALSLVIMSGCELFTGNNFVMAAGSFRRTIRWRETFKLWGICYLGNLVGSWIAVLLYHLTDLDGVSTVTSYFLSTSVTKLSLFPHEMIVRGILCNILVCVAVWCSIKMTSESGKLIMTLWCILIFMVCGFEHSIANMSIVGVAMLNTAGSGVTITVLAYIKDLFFVTLGNIIGGTFFVAFPYYLMSIEKKG